MKKDKLEDKVYNYPTKYKEGFIYTEIDALLKEYEGKLNMDKWYDAMMCNTGIVIDGNFITYHCDVLTGLRCAIYDRGLKIYEFD